MSYPITLYQSIINDINNIENLLLKIKENLIEKDILQKLLKDLEIIINNKSHLGNYSNLANSLYLILNQKEYNIIELNECTESWLVIFFIIRNNKDIEKHFNDWTYEQRNDYLNGLFLFEDFSNYKIEDGKVIETK